MNARVWSSWSWCVPPVETQVVSMLPPGHPCLFFFFLHILRFPFPFAVPRFPLSFRFVFFRLFLVSLFFSSPCSTWGRILFFCLGATPPRALLASLLVCVFPLCAVFFLFVAFLVFVLFFLLFLPFFRYRFGRHIFHPVFFLWVLFMLSPRFRFLLRLCSSH